MKTLRTIRNCSDIFQFRCEREWDALRPTDDPLARHCDTCDQNVHLCRNDEETIEHARAGHCIAREIPASAERPAHLGAGLPHRSIEDIQSLQALSWLRREKRIDRSIREGSWSCACRGCGFAMRPEVGVCPVCGADDVARERNSKAADAAFEDARQLGGMVHRALIDQRYGARGFRARIRSDEKVLMDVAHSQFEADPEFRRLWLSVKQQPPSLADLPWLRLWKNG